MVPSQRQVDPLGVCVVSRLANNHLLGYTGYLSECSACGYRFLHWPSDLFQSEGACKVEEKLSVGLLQLNILQ